MKKLITFLVTLLLVVTLAACSSNSGSSDTGSSEDTTQESSQSSSASTESSDGEDSAGQSTASGSNTLVVYYSATGNTQKVADYIAEATGGETFELVPVEEYSDEDLDYTNEESRVYTEYENESERDVELVETNPPDWDSYDTVFLGYPIWWGEAAWPVDGFVTGNDFSGKTVIPFCTSSSSGIGDSGEVLSQMAGSGTWLKGERFPSNASQDEVDEWVSGLETDGEISE